MFFVQYAKGEVNTSNRIGIYVNFQSNQISHYKNLYHKNDQMLGAYLVDMHPVSKGQVVIVPFVEDSLQCN